MLYYSENCGWVCAGKKPQQSNIFSVLGISKSKPNNDNNNNLDIKN